MANAAVLTKRELEVMEIMWDFGASMRRKDFVDLSDERNFNISNFNLVINKLLDYGMIKVDEIVKIGKTFGRMYSPTITREEYYAAQIKGDSEVVGGGTITKVLSAFVDDIDDDPKAKRQTIRNIIAALVDDREFNDDTISKLLQIIDES